MSHLVPTGCPLYLISFIVFIETLRLIIRPLTLSIRLIANIRAGHLLIFLVRKSYVIRVCIVSIEVIVRFIQRFVFTLLLTLYFNERN